MDVVLVVGTAVVSVVWTVVVSVADEWISFGVAARDGVVVSDADFAGVPSGPDEQLSVVTVGEVLLADVNLTDVPSVVEQLLVVTVLTVLNLAVVPSLAENLLVGAVWNVVVEADATGVEVIDDVVLAVVNFAGVPSVEQLAAVRFAVVSSVEEQLLVEQVGFSAVDSADEFLESGNKLRLF